MSELDKSGMFDATKGVGGVKSRIGAMLNAGVGAPAQNFDGFPAYEHGVKSDYARTVLANVIKNNYYTNSAEQLAEAIDLHTNMIASDPMFHLRGLILARKLNMKIQVKLGIACWDAYLAEHAKGDMIADESKVTIEKILTDLLGSFHPGQILEYIEICKGKAFGKGFGTAQKKRINRVLAKWDRKWTEYYTLKYRSDCRDIVSITHPTKKDLGDKFDLYKYCLDRKIANGERQKAFKSMQGMGDEEKFGKVMIDQDLPWDLFKNAKLQTPRSWFARMVQMGTNALLLNIESLNRHDVFNFDEAFKYLREKLKPELLTKARLLPLDVLKPYQMTSNDDVKNILVKAFADSFSSTIPELEGKQIACTIDISGSMAGENLLRAVCFAASLLPSIGKDNLWLSFFDDKLYEQGQKYKDNGYYGSGGGFTLPDLNKCKTNEEMVKEILKAGDARGGATNTGLFLDKAMKDGKKYDVLILMTDEEQNTGRGAYELFRRYKKRINPEAVLVVINVTQYRWHNFPKDRDIVTFQGVNSNILKSLPYLMSGTEKLINEIKFKTN